MAGRKPGRPRKGELRGKPVKEVRVGLYIMPETRSRLNHYCRRLGNVSQDTALSAALTAVGVPQDVPDAPDAQVSA